LARAGRTKVVKPRNRTGEAITERWYEPPRLKVPVDPRRDHIAGPVNASLTLLEYGDFQCPFCAAAVPEIKKAQRELDSQMRFVFRHFPMTSVHRFAAKAAEMAEAAGAQGKFWEMHDLLFAKQDMLGDDPYILGYAEALGLDVQRLAEEVSVQLYLPRIQEDFMGGVRSGVNGTPTFFINGVRYDGPHSSKFLVEALLSDR
jgi:protein-disulfide isomerase